MTIQEVIENVESLLGDGSFVEFQMDSPKIASIKEKVMKCRARSELSMKGIATEIPSDKSCIRFSRVGGGVQGPSNTPISDSTEAEKPTPKPSRYQHTYVPPKIAKDLMDVLLDDGSHVVWLKGPTGGGKSTLCRYLASELGFKLYQINCRDGMGPENFFGDNTIDIDPDTGQNHIVFRDGPVVKAMQEGLDEQGNEVGDPALLFIDEAAAIPPNIGIALNRMLESDDPRRTVTIDQDGGRVVRSHSGFRIILAANTAGRGATSMEEASYTAQMDALDISLLDRMAMVFKIGYNKKAEKLILMEKMANDAAVSKVIKFRDAVRDNLRAGRLSTPFSTRTIINIADAYRIFGDIGKAIYYAVFERLLPDEVVIYNETAIANLNVDILASVERDDDIDYM